MIFTWKSFFVKMRQMYLMIIHPIMIYTTIIWHKFIDKLNENSNDKFFVTQNICLRTIIKIFKTISIQIFKKKWLFRFSTSTWTNYRRKPECGWEIQVAHGRLGPPATRSRGAYAVSRNHQLVKSLCQNFQNRKK